jgi:hypothetical protein
VFRVSAFNLAIYYLKKIGIVKIFGILNGKGKPFEKDLPLLKK